MKSLRLNKQMREDILSSFVDKYLTANPAPNKVNTEKLLSNLAIQLSDKLYGKYKGLVPDDLYYTNSYIKVQLPNDSISNLFFW